MNEIEYDPQTRKENFSAGSSLSWFMIGHHFDFFCQILCTLAISNVITAIINEGILRENPTDTTMRGENESGG